MAPYPFSPAPSVAAGEEGALAPNAASRDVVGDVGCDHAWETGHDNGECEKQAEDLKKTSRPSQVSHYTTILPAECRVLVFKPGECVLKML